MPVLFYFKLVEISRPFIAYKSFTISRETNAESDETARIIMYFLLSYFMQDKRKDSGSRTTTLWAGLTEMAVYSDFP